MKSTATMEYAQALLQTPSVTTYSPSSATRTVGDFTGTIENDAGEVTVTVTGGPDWWTSSIVGNSSSFQLY